MTAPTARETIEKTRRELKQKAFDIRMRAEEKAKKHMEEKGIETNESSYFFKQALRANIMRETGKTAKAEQIESELNNEITLYKKLKKEAETIAERMKKEEILPLRPLEEIKENTMDDLRMLERNKGVKIFDGGKISGDAEKLLRLILKKNTAETYKEMAELVSVIMKEADVLREKQEGKRK